MNILKYYNVVNKRVDNYIFIEYIIAVNYLCKIKPNPSISNKKYYNFTHLLP